MSLKGKKVFSRKPYNSFLYKWAPDTSVVKGDLKKGDKAFFCTATPRSQGDDFITTYVYERLVVDGNVRRFAYVECGYVK